MGRPDHQPGARGTDRFGRPLWLHSDQAIIDAIQRIAEARGVSMAQVAGVGAEERGRRRAHRGRHHAYHLVDAAAALDLELTDDEVAALEEPYVLRQTTWF